MSGRPVPGGPGDLLDRVLAGEAGAFALLHRPEAAPGEVEVLAGEASTAAALADLPGPRPGGAGSGERHDVLAVVPYRQIGERGFAHVDDGAPLIALRVGEQASVPLHQALDRIPDTGIRASGGRFDPDDAAYAATARRIITEEIGRGEGANFVLKRRYTAVIEDFSARGATTLFRRLLRRESGTYWTYAVYTPYGAFVGASPERHVSLRGGTAVMNPISGTYRYPESGPTLDGVLEFLDDRKEADELYMVVDEELKMMARACDSVPRVTGPHLKEMARLAHTEYFIEGACSGDPREVLRQTMFAPTVTGSPLESACRVIARHEPEGRGHYSGVVALMGRDAAGASTLDSAIMIRTAEIDPAGRLSAGVGATLVRHSDPGSEVQETRAKAAGLLGALDEDGPPELGRDPRVRSVLARRNERVSGFWLGTEAHTAVPALRGLDVLVIDHEDTFTGMLARQLESLGPSVRVRRFDEPGGLCGPDLVVMGPGPGDPRDDGHHKIAAVRAGLRTLLSAGRPFLAVCLSHQVLSRELGLEVVRKEVPNQGLQLPIDLFGRRERVGFYNTFTAVAQEDKIVAERSGVGPVEVGRDPRTGEVHALRGAGFASLQFHSESLLTQGGVAILSRVMEGVLSPP
ncbi:anthranilate synthase family protein [Nocardiopsis sp. RSe5-2]|uniref:anthranilate synthase n=1 Tax=Nocardiopsis endophytica TaxID=3018445 RepID=A0ABT4U8P2_9ACTN|nr:anthranilate synthase family protein [Nocardiopsis endophytica]MDA2813325.1 anthranilate synthase family protein [Nocardiopsis endophytica]